VVVGVTGSVLVAPLDSARISRRARRDAVSSACSWSSAVLFARSVVAALDACIHSDSLAILLTRSSSLEVVAACCSSAVAMADAICFSTTVGFFREGARSSSKDAIEPRDGSYCSNPKITANRKRIYRSSDSRDRKVAHDTNCYVLTS
jgi:hypothetical protein